MRWLSIGARCSSCTDIKTSPRKRRWCKVKNFTIQYNWWEFCSQKKTWCIWCTLLFLLLDVWKNLSWDFRKPEIYRIQSSIRFRSFWGSETDVGSVKFIHVENFSILMDLLFGWKHLHLVQLIFLSWCYVCCAKATSIWQRIAYQWMWWELNSLPAWSCGRKR